MLKNANEKATCLHSMKKHTNSIYSTARINENVVCSGSYDRSIRFWDINNGNECFYLSNIDNVISHTTRSIWCEGNIMVTGHDDSNVNIWRIVDHSPEKFQVVHVETVKTKGRYDLAIWKEKIYSAGNDQISVIEKI